MRTMWMVRSGGGKQYDHFRDRGAGGIGWPQIAPITKPAPALSTVTWSITGTRQCPIA